MTKQRITQFPFSQDSIVELQKKTTAKNWPVVYILENTKEAYIGETTSAIRRMKDHLDNKKRDKFRKIFLIEDEKFNKSATLDIESMLIEYISADGTYLLQNSNKGLRNHNYYEKQSYINIFEEIWTELRNLNIAKNMVEDIRNSDLFKYSPYKSLTEDQHTIVEEISRLIKTRESISLVKGEPGSGKTILAIYLCKFLISEEETKHLKIGLVLPQTSLRGTIKKVFKNIKGLKAKMAMGPNDVVNDNEMFDVLIVDEAHRLAKRRNLSSYEFFDKPSRKLGLDPEKCSQLDWMRIKAKHLILLYDENQSVKPSDVDKESFARITKKATEFRLTSQQRVLAGDGYTQYLENILRNLQKNRVAFDEYDFLLYSELQQMVNDIQARETEYGLSRIAAGYAWDWKSKEAPESFDIQIQNCRLRWNSTAQDWINSSNAINEVGCIHTVQGYDLNYTGVIIGPELVYKNDVITFISENYKDRYGTHHSISPEGMLTYIINIYKTLMTRGVRGTYIYACDEGLHDYLAKYIPLTRKEYGESAASTEPVYRM